MATALFIKGWFIFATAYTCVTLGNQVGDHYLGGARWPWFIAVTIMGIIIWVSSSKLRKLK